MRSWIYSGEQVACLRIRSCDQHRRSGGSLELCFRCVMYYSGLPNFRMLLIRNQSRDSRAVTTSRIRRSSHNYRKYMRGGRVLSKLLVISIQSSIFLHGGFTWIQRNCGARGSCDRSVVDWTSPMFVFIKPIMLTHLDISTINVPAKTHPPMLATAHRRYLQSHGTKGT